MLADNLSTMSKNRLLETGGMIYMEASLEGTPLKIKEGKNIFLAMPGESPKTDMQLFSGTEIKGQERMDWTPTGQKAGFDLDAWLNMPPKPSSGSFNIPLSGKFECDESSKPAEPKLPRKPAPPQKPRIESFKYNPGFFKVWSLGKEKIKKIETERYEKALAEYEKRQKQYEEKTLPNYQADLETYKSAMSDFKEKMLAWEENCEQEKEEFYIQYKKKGSNRIACT